MLTNMLGILTASLHLRLVVWNWEHLFNASELWHRSIGGVVELSKSVQWRLGPHWWLELTLGR